MPEINWDSKLYDKQHHFVSDYGADVLQWLNPASGEYILDLGCGTGQLAAQIAESGAKVLGIDASPSMISRAKNNYPGLEFRVEDATNLEYFQQFDAIFSNATFHWIEDQYALTQCLFKSLKNEGRLVAEFGGKGNVRGITAAIKTASEELGLGAKLKQDSWYFPSISDYTSLLEENGFSVEQAWLFDRPTPLKGENGMYDWINQFAQHALTGLENADAEKLKNLAVEILKTTHYRHGKWMADYKRLRIKATKTTSTYNF